MASWNRVTMRILREAGLWFLVAVVFARQGEDCGEHRSPH